MPAKKQINISYLFIRQDTTWYCCYILSEIYEPVRDWLPLISGMSIFIVFNIFLMYNTALFYLWADVE